MKSDNFRVTIFDRYKHACIGRDDVSARQGHYLYASAPFTAVRKMAKQFPTDQFFDVQAITADGDLSAPTRYTRDGLEVLKHGDRFILCRFSIGFGCMVEDSSDDLGELLSKVPDHLCDDDAERISVCEVGYWVLDPSDPSDGTPKNVTTLYEVQHYADPSCEDEEEASAEAV